MAGAATEMLLRSMYVSRYIRLIRNRTTHRVFVGLTAAFAEMALDSRRGGMLGSNIVSVITSRRTMGCDRSPGDEAPHMSMFHQGPIVHFSQNPCETAQV